MVVYLFGVSLLATFQQNKTFTKVFFKYINYANVFFPDLAIELLKNAIINKNAIELIEDK